MKNFLFKIFAFCIPLIAVVVAYVATDVFKVIYHYDPFYVDSYPVNLNRAYGSTMTYINQNPKYHYNSFIFGNSRSLFYEIDTWKKYLPEGSSCMHFDESFGSISGLYEKVSFIDRQGGDLDNALLVLDPALLSSLEINEGYLFIAPPILKNNENWVSFHFQNFMAFLNPKFLFALVDYKMFGKFRPYMHLLLNDNRSTYIPEYNEFQKTYAEDAISNGTYYDEARLKFFYDVQHPEANSPELLTLEGIKYLRSIKGIFDKHNTSYKIVISPIYDQIKLKRDTYYTLCDIFEEKNIYDFSGVNKWNKDYHNYYEASHYRPNVSAEIMDIIYSTEGTSDTTTSDKP